MKKSIIIIFSFILLLVGFFLVIHYYKNNKIDIGIKKVVIFQDEIFDLSYYSNSTYTYRTENMNIATVNEKGKITGIKEGKTNLIIESKTESYSLDIVVNPVHFEKLELNREFDIELDSYKKYNISNKSIISFEDNKIKGLSLGSSAIIIDIDGTSKVKYNFEIIDVKLQDYELNIENNQNIYVGDIIDISVDKIDPEDAKTKDDLEITIDNNEVASYKSGKLTALKSGKLVINSNYNDVKKEYNVAIYNRISKVSIDKNEYLEKLKDNYYLFFGRLNNDYDLDFDIEPLYTLKSDVTVTSSDKNVVLVSNNILKIKNIGTADLLIKVKSNSDILITIKVLVIPDSVYSQTTYSKITYLKKFTSSSQLTWKYDVPENSTFKCAQSMILSDKYIVVNQISGLKGRLNIVDRTTFKGIFSKVVERIGHANGATYNYKTGEYLIAPSTTPNTLNLTGLYSFNIDIEKEDVILNNNEFLNGIYTNRIGYDRTLDVYATGTGEETVIYDYVNNVELKRFSQLRGGNQDITIHNGVIYKANSTGYVDLYRITDGGYLGSYNFSFFEIEDLEVLDDNTFLLLFYRPSNNLDKIYTTDKMLIFK